MTNDLISRTLILDEAKRISGPITGDGWDNWGVYGLIERQPSVPAVPLDKLCECLVRKRIGFVDEVDGKRMTGELTKEAWEALIREWMEELDAAD